MSGKGDISLTARFVLLSLLALVLMVVDNYQNHLARVRELFLLAVNPIYVVVDLPFVAWDSATGMFRDRRDLQRENEQLRRELITARYRLQNLNTLELEVDRLQELLDTSEELTEDRVLIARILNVDPDRYRKRFVINRGTADGVYVGQPLLDARGVIGQVESVSLMQAQALMITDADHAMQVAIERNGLRTIAEGTGDGGELRLVNLTNNANVVPGDRLVTTGLGGIYPPGRPVGIITEFTRRPSQNFAYATAVPVAALDSYQEVLLVWNESPDETIDGTVARGVGP